MLLAAHPPLVLKRSRRTTAGGLRPGLVCRADAKSIAVQYYEQVWSKGDESLGKQLLAENHIQHDRGWWGGRESVGREKMLSGIASFRKAYPDLKFTVDEAHACEPTLPSRVFVHWRAEGTNTAGMFGREPTMKPMSISGISLLTVGADSRIESSQVYRQATGEELYGAMQAGLPTDDAP